MKKTFLYTVLAAVVTLTMSSASFAADRVRLTGSGASFPAPIYLGWFKSLNKANPNLIIDYQSKGCGAGVQDFLNKTVDLAERSTSLL